MVKRTAIVGIALLWSLGAPPPAFCEKSSQSSPISPTPLFKPPPESKVLRSPSGLQFVDLVAGKGDIPKPGDICIVHYTAWLEDGTEIQSSRKPRPVDPRDPSKGEKVIPFGFKLGSGQVLRGWDEGVSTMREGGTRLLFLPPQLAYGSKGIANVVPPDSHVTFRVELLKIKHDTAVTAATPGVPAKPAAPKP